jgi:two-component sensor histidine kinase
MSVDHSKISVTVDVLPLRVTGEIAVPLALFAVEALVNIFRHAFPSERPSGRVVVSLRRSGNGDFCLAIEDNGVGFSADNVRPGIGDRLLKVFGRQIRGTVAIDSQAGRGTRVELMFPAESSDARRDAAE